MPNPNSEEIQLPYGDRWLEGFLPEDYQGEIRVLKKERKQPDFDNVEKRLREVLNNPPEGIKSLSELIKGYYKSPKKVVVIVDDNTRPNTHTKILLPLFIPYLQELGVKREDVTILVAAGTHKPPPPDGMIKIFGEEFLGEYEDIIEIHSCDEGNISIGKSEAGTPIKLDERVVNAAIVIPVTDSELHYFAGVAGTIKSIVPGIASRETVGANHPRMFDERLGFKPECRLGNTKGNPVIEDIANIVEIVAKHVPIFGIDTIVDGGQIVYLSAGELLRLHRAAAPRITNLRTVPVKTPADLVIVAPGILGINLYQAGKGVHAAWNAVRKDGKSKIILLAPCPDDVGNEAYLQTMQEVKDLAPPDALKEYIARFCSETTFRIGNQKPVDLFRIIMDIGTENLHVISDMNHELLRTVFRFNPIQVPEKGNEAATLKQFIEKYVQGKETPPRIYIIDDPGIYVTIT
ncbi:MAG: lactate racemase domain-containing protein [Candidatus Hodarchaeota archaeon]